MIPSLLKAPPLRLPSLLRLFALSALMTGIIGALVFITTDRRVARRLAENDPQSVGVIFGDTFRISAGIKVNPESLVRRLESRSYSRVIGSPEEAGQYAINHGIIEVVTRRFRDARGKLVPSLRASYNFATSKVSVVGDPRATGFSVEPTILAPLGEGTIRRSTYRKLSEIPEKLQKAVIVIEDRRFYLHFGVDPIGIMRALWRNIVAGHIVEGGSTLTQQLAKNLLLTPRKTLGRKIIEMFAAFSLELRLTKDKILEHYLNEVYFTQEGAVAVHGVSQAAKTFFAKNLHDLSISESALLAGMVQAPSAYSPKRNLTRSLERRDVVLQAMLNDNLITDAEYAAAIAEKIEIQKASPQRRAAPYFVATLQRELETALDTPSLATERINVYTGFDPELQRCAESAIEAALQRLDERTKSKRKEKSGDTKKSLQQALVAIEPYSGTIKAWVGGRNFQANQFDHVAQARRQIGSTIKPFLYLAALDKSLNSYKTATPVSVLGDEPTSIRGVSRTKWAPQNYDHSFRGDVTLRYALEHSLNLPAVYVAQRIGISALVAVLKRFQIATEIPAVPSLALGALDTTLLNLTSSYGALANGGRLMPPRLYRSAVDASNRVVLAPAEKEQEVADEGATFVLTDILRGVIDRGTGQVVRRLGFSRPAAGKTGTSDGARDAWFVGYTPRLVVGVWSGYDDNRKMGLTGGAASAPTWAEFMKCAAPFSEDLEFIQPPSVSQQEIDTRCFGLATDSTPTRFVTRELFVKGTEPSHICAEEESASHDEEILDPDRYTTANQLGRARRRSDSETQQLEDYDRRDRETESPSHRNTTGRRPSIFEDAISEGRKLLKDILP